MDSGRLPAYRSSYLLRFHPYPRVKPSARERTLASTRDDGLYEPLPVDIKYPENDTQFTLNQAIHGPGAYNEIHLRQRRLSMSSLVVELAFLLTKELRFRDG